MSGIGGIYHFGDGEPVAQGALLGMLRAMAHRGPDDEGVYVAANLGIGARRLSAIDLVGGGQPLSSEDGQVTVVCDGVIGNYRRMRTQLQARGHSFYTQSDTEVIVHLYEDLGAECVHALRGMFALAIWDARRRQLFLARDRLGIKPLYYIQGQGRLIFASEIKAILQEPTVEARPNLQGLGDYLSLGYVPAPATMFEGIEALPPGCRLICHRGGVRVERYWDLAPNGCPDGSKSEDEYAARLEALLREAMRIALVSDVPVGALLSGGIASLTMAALLGQHLGRPAQTFSISFEGSAESISELFFARAVARRLGTEHHEALMRAEQLASLAEKVVWHLDQPVADASCLASYVLAECASHQVKVVLTGEGGDELFAGEADQAGGSLSPVWRHIPRGVRSLARAVATQGPLSRRQRGQSGPDAPRQLQVKGMANWSLLLNEGIKADLLIDTAEAQRRGPCAPSQFRRPDGLIACADRMSLAASVEARLPLLDPTVVEFVAGLPPQFRLSGPNSRCLLHKVAHSWLPEEIIARSRPKAAAPLGAWFRHQARQFLRDTLSPEAIGRRGLFSPKGIEALLHEHEAGRADRASSLWGVLNVELWYRLFIDRAHIAEGVREMIAGGAA